MDFPAKFRPNAQKFPWIFGSTGAQPYPAPWLFPWTEVEPYLNSLRSVPMDYGPAVPESMAAFDNPKPSVALGS
jgi:hypothetical protein